MSLIEPGLTHSALLQKEHKAPTQACPIVHDKGVYVYVSYMKRGAVMDWTVKFGQVCGGPHPAICFRLRGPLRNYYEMKFWEWENSPKIKIYLRREEQSEIGIRAGIWESNHVVVMTQMKDTRVDVVNYMSTRFRKRLSGSKHYMIGRKKLKKTVGFSM